MYKLISIMAILMVVLVCLCIPILTECVLSVVSLYRCRHEWTRRNSYRAI